MVNLIYHKKAGSYEITNGPVPCTYIILWSEIADIIFDPNSLRAVKCMNIPKTEFNKVHYYSHTVVCDHTASRTNLLSGRTAGFRSRDVAVFIEIDLQFITSFPIDS